MLPHENIDKKFENKLEEDEQLFYYNAEIHQALSSRRFYIEKIAAKTKIVQFW